MIVMMRKKGMEGVGDERKRWGRLTVDEMLMSMGRGDGEEYEEEEEEAGSE